MASPRKPSAPGAPDGAGVPTTRPAPPAPTSGPNTLVDEDLAKTLADPQASLPPPPRPPSTPPPGIKAVKPPDATSTAPKNNNKGANGADKALSAGLPPAPTPPPLIKPPAASPAMSKLGPTPIDEGLLANLPTQVSPGSGGPLPQEVTLAPPRISVIGGNDRGREFTLEAKDCRIGRGTDNDIILTDIAVSRHHVMLRFDGARHRVRDLGSGNGTLLNGDRLEEERLLHDGDQLELGNTLMRFEQPGLSVPPPVAGPEPFGPSPMFSSDPGVSAPAGVTAGGTVVAPNPYQGMPTPSSVQPIPATPGTSYAVGPAAYASPYATYPPVQFPGGTPAFDLAEMRKRKLIVLGAAAGGAILLIILIALMAGHDGGPEARSTEAQPMGGLFGPPRRPEPSPAPSPAPSQIAAPSPSPAVVPPPPPEAAPAPSPAPVPETAAIVEPLPSKPSPPPKKEPKEPKEPREPKEPKVDKSVAALDKVEKGAFKLYGDKSFEEAAQMLRDAAAKTTGPNAERLTLTARDYAAVGAGLDKAAANATTNAPVALTALQDALRADNRSGRQLHAANIRLQLSRVAPKAATQHYSAGRFEYARMAADAAVNYGAGGDPQVAKVRSLLEAKAKEFYTTAQRSEKQNAAAAKQLYQRVLRMVPADSVWYTKAYAALNKPTGAKKRLDEDE